MAQLSHTEIDSDLAERLRQMEIVCIYKYQSQGRLGRVGTSSKTDGNLDDVGKRFGLTRGHLEYCKGRARNFIDEMRELDRERNRADTKRYGSAGRPRQIRIVASAKRLPLINPIDRGWNVRGDGTWQIEEIDSRARRSLAPPLLKEAA